MPCSKKPLVKKWDHPRQIPKVSPSKYEQNEASVKVHWRNVIKQLELSYKDDKFWDTQSELVRSLVGPTIFRQLIKIFNLQTENVKYEPNEEMLEVIPSQDFYSDLELDESRMNHKLSFASIGIDDTYYIEDEEILESDQSNESEDSGELKNLSKSRSVNRSKSFASRLEISRSENKSFSKKSLRSQSTKSKLRVSMLSDNRTASTNDDLIVHTEIKSKRYKRNPHYNMLYCNESETDMIKWPSKYKQKGFEVSASDEFSKKAEIMAKKISKEFYDWWVGLGNLDFKSDIRTPNDIEDLFQVWFDEHASQAMVLDSKILPCVISSIAKYLDVPKADCSKVLKKQIAFDIEAEASPVHKEAFNACLPHKLKHIPPNNNTAEIWEGVKIPEDLRTMSYVWEDIKHLTSTKSFLEYLKHHPHLPVPPCLRPQTQKTDKKQLFIMPSDFLFRDRSSSSSSTHELSFPVSRFEIEIKEHLKTIMGD